MMGGIGGRMSTLPSAGSSQICTSTGGTSASALPWRGAAIAALLATAGVIIIWPAALLLWGLWVTDPLKSIGMLVPIASFALILRAWRSIGWETRGTWWGLALLALTAVSVYVREHATLVLVVAPWWNVYFPPNSLVAFAYVSGAVLLFGGTRLFRAALFPIFLILMVNPVPHIFNVFVDLPLQRTSAHVARAFAHALGQPLTPDQMRLMFTPDFGMFIAPGCNGIRGAVTMGMIALIVGYLSRFRWYAHALLVAAAVLLGYLFNFVRLCTLVVYYIAALHFTGLQSHGEIADYIIGAFLFLFATWLLTYVVRHATHFTRSEQDTPHPQQSLSSRPDPERASRVRGPVDGPASLPLTASGMRSYQDSPSLTASLYPRFAAMTFLILIGTVAFARAYTASSRSARLDHSILANFPAHIGSYTLTRSWNEYATGGPVIFQWADYAPADGSAHIAIGISPVLGSHDTLICHSARGEDPIWHAELPASTAAGTTTFSAAFFADGATQYLETTTLCNGSTCGEYSDNRRHFGFVYSRPSAAALFSRDPQRPIPIMLRAETIDTALPPDLARQQLTADTRAFLAYLSLDDLTRPYRH